MQAVRVPAQGEGQQLSHRIYRCHFQFLHVQVCFLSFSRHHYIFVHVLERLGQGHLHRKLEVPRLTCLGRESNTHRHGGRRAIRTAYQLLPFSGTSKYKPATVLKFKRSFTKDCFSYIGPFRSTIGSFLHYRNLNLK